MATLTRREWLFLAFIALFAAITLTLAFTWPQASPNLISPLPLPTRTSTFPSRETVVYATQAGDVVLHDVKTGEQRVVLEEVYRIVQNECSTCFSIYAPMRASPDGRWLLIPTSEHGTWLAATDGSGSRLLHPDLLTATWSPDSQHITYMADMAGPGENRDDIYVQDIVTGAAPRLLAQFDRAVYPTWSPGCEGMLPSASSSCGQHIFVIAPEHGEVDDSSTVWLIHAASGERRELGQFAPPGMELSPANFQWSPAGDAVWVPHNWPLAMRGLVALPLDGSRAQPVVEGCLFAGCSPQNASADRIYTSSSWRILHKADGEIEAMSPDGHNRNVVEGVQLLGLFEQLMQRSTEVAMHAKLQPLPQAAHPSNWSGAKIAEHWLSLPIPNEWYFQAAPDANYLANFMLDGSQGGVALGKDQILIKIETNTRFKLDADFDSWLARVEHELSANYFQLAVTAWGGDGKKGAQVRSTVLPVAEHLIIPLPNTAIIITRWPLDSTQNYLFNYMIRGIASSAPPAEAVITSLVELRVGPGLEYAIGDVLHCCETVIVRWRDESGEWYQLGNGLWVQAAAIPVIMGEVREIGYMGPG